MSKFIEAFVSVSDLTGNAKTAAFSLIQMNDVRQAC